MAVTRSATRSTTVVAAGNSRAIAAPIAATMTKTTTKRKATAAPKEPAKKKARATKGSSESSTPKTKAAESPTTHVIPPVPAAGGEELVPAVLSFSFEEAKQHLISVDPRFEDVFRRVSCTPFERLETVDPFRTLAYSILGQQISWKAAAAIALKFKRLFDPSISDDPDSSSDFFPSAHQVITKDITTLRTAGLSGRKAEYILDLATRFADGRLSTKRLLEADDEELHNMLTAVRGIGPWTVNMFAIFSLRRPDILPVGDLGVQRGMLRWFVSLHSPSYPISLRKDKLIDQCPDNAPAVAVGSSTAGADAAMEEKQNPTRATTPDASALPPAPETLLPSTPQKKKEKGKGADESDPMASMGFPETFTPSINRTLNMLGNPDKDGAAASVKVPPLPEGLTVAQMKARLTGKKIKGALLTPKEMEALAESWRPYRSLGVYYMWALSEEPK